MAALEHKQVMHLCKRQHAYRIMACLDKADVYTETQVPKVRGRRGLISHARLSTDTAKHVFVSS